MLVPAVVEICCDKCAKLCARGEKNGDVFDFTAIEDFLFGNDGECVCSDCEGEGDIIVFLGGVADKPVVE